MTLNTSVIACALGLLVGVAAIAHSNAGAPLQKNLRIGVYDPRAIAIAWAGSDFNPVKSKRAEFESAQKAGDVEKIKELKAWGPAQLSAATSLSGVWTRPGRRSTLASQGRCGSNCKGERPVGDRNGVRQYRS